MYPCGHQSLTRRMKSKNSTAGQKRKNTKPRKCPVCLNMYNEQKLDKHMHSRQHHEAIERLKGGKQMHKCWACDVCVLGMEQFETHISTSLHRTNMAHLQNCRSSENGFKVDYSDAELIDFCAKKHLELKKQREEKYLLKKQKFKPLLENKNRRWTFSEHSEQGDSCHVVSTLVKDVDFTNDHLTSPSMGIMFSSCHVDEDSSQQIKSGSRLSNNTEADLQKQGQKRRIDADPLYSAPVKRPCSTFTECVNQTFNKSDRSHPALSHVSSLSEMQGCSCTAETTGMNYKHTKPKTSTNEIFFVQSDEEKMSQSKETPFVCESCSEKTSAVYQKDGAVTSKKSHTGEATIKKKSTQIKCSGVNKTNGATNTNLLKRRKTDQQKEQELPQNRPSLPALLSRSVKTKEASKPNLNMARGIRKFQRPCRNEDQSKTLNPALQKLISSKSSDWKANWSEMYQEATKRKLQKEKGLPRFGIEFMSPFPPEPEGLVLEEVKDFQKNFINPDNVTASSSVAASTKDTFGSLPVEISMPSAGAANAEGQCGGKSTTRNRFKPMETVPMKRRENTHTKISGTHRTSEPKERLQINNALEAKPENTLKTACETQHNTTPAFASVHVKAEKLDYNGTEQLQTNEGHNIFVRHVKKEKLDNPKPAESNQRKMSDLLALSLREEKLSGILEDVDSQLCRSQATLQYTYNKILDLQEVKEEITAEMASLTTKRIVILQKMQNSSSASEISSL